MSMKNVSSEDSSNFFETADKIEIKEQKSNLRKLMRGKIKEWISSNNLEKTSLLACEKIISMDEYKKADILLAYIPMKNEADCFFAIEAALKSGKIVAVPKCDFELDKTEPCGAMDFYILKKSVPVEAQLEKGSFGIFEPVPSLEKFSLDLSAVSKKSLLALKIFMIVPCLAFSDDGKRLGKGRGYYDRYFERLENAGLDVFRCGFCLPCQITGDIPCGEFDRKVDRVVF